MFSFFKKDKAAQAAAPESSSSGVSAAAAVEQPAIYGICRRIAEDQYGVTELKQVHMWTPTEEVRKSPGQFYCFDMEEAELAEAVRWVRAARHVEPFETRRLPIIIVIGPRRPLKREELRAVNDDLKPAGGYFYKRPDNASFEAAMDALQDELIKQYGPAGRRDEWRHPQVIPI